MLLTKEQKAAKKANKALDELVAQAYNRHGNNVQINIMDISNIYRDCKAAHAAGSTMDDAMITAIAKYRQN
jgi:maltose-binding protein MalE